MNKIYLILLLVMLSAALTAQTGLFELSFGDSRETALATLEKVNFSITDDSGTKVTLADEDNSLVEGIVLNFSEKDSTLVGWTVTYIEQEDEDIESTVIGILGSWHGDDYVWDDDMEEYYWYLDDTHTVAAWYDYFDSYFIVDYYIDR